MAARSKSVVSDAEQVQLAAELARLGARLQVLETETQLSRERLLRLYKEVRGESPPKGVLPFSTDWFMSWMPNIHASIFVNIHSYLVTHAQALTKDYECGLCNVPSRAGKTKKNAAVKTETPVRAPIDTPKDNGFLLQSLMATKSSRAANAAALAD